MEYRRLGKTQRMVSAIGFGAWAIGGDWGTVDDANSLRALHAAADAGVTLFDTADVYGDGRSERLIGQFLRERSGESLFVATKMGRRVPLDLAQYTPEAFRGWVDRSRDNLGVDRLDLVQLHCLPTAIYYRPEIFAALDDLVSAQAIASYGVSVERVEEALKAIEFPGVASVQIIYNIVRQRPAERFLAEAARRDVGVLARVPLASGLLTGKLTKTFHSAQPRFTGGLAFGGACGWAGQERGGGGVGERGALAGPGPPRWQGGVVSPLGVVRGPPPEQKSPPGLGRTGAPPGPPPLRRLRRRGGPPPLGGRQPPVPTAGRRRRCVSGRRAKRGGGPKESARSRHSPEALSRQRPGRRRRESARRPRRDLRVPRTQRRGQIDHHPDAAGNDCAHQRARRAVRRTSTTGATGLWRRVGHLVDTAIAYPELTVRENLDVARRLQAATQPTVVDRAIEQLRLSEYADRRAGTLSLGNLQRLALARALLHEPSLLVLDEPANGLDPAGVIEVRELLRTLARERGVTVFMSSHILAEVDRLATRIGIVHRGRLIEELDSDALERHRDQRLEVGARHLDVAERALCAAGYAPQRRVARRQRHCPRAARAARHRRSGGDRAPARRGRGSADTPRVTRETLEDHFIRLTRAADAIAA